MDAAPLTQPARSRILIVEDEGIIAGHIASRLEKSGYEVAGIAESSEEALAQIADLKPELVLMDIHIKGAKDGIETVRFLRAESDIPVIYLTAHMDEQTINRAKLTRASAFLSKPIHHAALATAIEMAIYKHRADCQVQQQRAWITTILSTMANAMVVIDRESRVQFLNGLAEDLTGWNNEEALHHDIAEVLPIVDPRSGKQVNHLLTPPDHPQQPTYLPRGLMAANNSGQWFNIEGEISASSDRGNVAGVVITFRDATTRQAQEEQLRHGTKMQAVGRLAGGIAHDFNNLLFVILGYTEDLIRTSATTDHALKALSEIRKAGESAARITDQLLKFSRSEAVEKFELDINESIRDSEEMLRRLAGPAVKFELQLDRNLRRVRADRGYLKQVLLNLVVNARDAMPEGGRLTIKTADVQSFVSLSVADTGCGMTAEVAEHLFEPFFTTKPMGKGTGLGLAIVHSIVSDLGGTIQVASEPGKGALFNIQIPHVATLRAPAELRQEARATVAAEQPTVLLVEDEILVRQLLRTYLADSPCKLLLAENGAEAIRMAQESSERIDLLITDVVMPKLNGFEVSRTVSSRWPDVKTLFISGTALELAEGREVLPSGARYLPKPFVRSELLREMKELLNLEQTGANRSAA
jgi:hypothetical protein